MSYGFTGTLHRKSDPELSLAESEEDECCDCNNPFCWATPSADSLPAAYCLENTMHGLKYIAAPQRHLTERICWLISFLIGIAAAVFLINSVWDNYHKNPVIVTFMPTEMEIKDIPFPAVTFCNMNRFPKSLYNRMLGKQMSFDYQARKAARVRLQLLKNICGSSQSFAQKFNFAATRGEMKFNVSMDSLNHTDTVTEFIQLLVEETVPCDQLIRLCTWAQEVVNCSDFFHPIVTEFGKCCTFNMLPIQLLFKRLLRDSQNQPTPPEPSPESLSEAQTDRDLDDWMKWNYAETGFTLPPELKRPRRQTRAGIPSGLSVLLDPNLDNYFCPSTDSEGFRVALHSALDTPPVQSHGKVVSMGKEIFVSIEPSMTLSDKTIEKFPYQKRHCYFPLEQPLAFFKMYTSDNCFLECIANTTVRQCGCAQFHMPRGRGTRICSSDPDSADFKCANEVQYNLSQNYAGSCSICDALCTDIKYKFDLTQAELQSSRLLWLDPEDNDIPEWANNSMSIMHIYFGMDFFVPHVRRQLYAPVDLIANTGGLLGLCLGFSALSAVEIVYFFTLRWFWQRIRRKTVGRRIANKFIKVVQKIGEKKKQGRAGFQQDQTVHSQHPHPPALAYPTHSAHRNHHEDDDDDQYYWRGDKTSDMILPGHTTVLPVLPLYTYALPSDEQIRVLPLAERGVGPRRKKVLKGTFYRGPL